MSSFNYSDIYMGIGVRGGKNFNYGKYCMIEEDCIIGDNVEIKNYVEIREGCQIDDNVKIGSRVTLAARTWIHHDVEIKYGCVFTDTPKIGEEEREPCMVMPNVKIGANVTVMPGVIIFEGATIGACSQVRKDVPVGETWYGNPAQADYQYESNI